MKLKKYRNSLTVCLALTLAWFTGATCQSQELQQPLDNTTNVPGLFIEPKNTSSVTRHVKEASDQFMLEVQQSRNSPRFNEHFDYTIEKEKFLGEPVIANLGTDRGDRTYYIVILHYNIPTVKTSVLPVKYGFARFASRFVIVDPANGGQPQKVDLLAVYPTNELLDISHSDKGTNTFHVEPKYQQASAGFYEYKKERSDTYKFELPKVIATTNRYGEAAWTYYPAKLQPLILGSKTAFAVLSIPQSAKKTLRLECSLDYQLKRLKLLPFPTRSVQDTIQVSLSNAPTLDDVLKIHTVDLPIQVAERIKQAFRPAPEYATSEASKNDLLIDKGNGKLYRYDVQSKRMEHIDLAP